MAEHSDQITVIGADSHFKGDLSFEKSARIDGKFDGQISCKGELHVSHDALCKADVDAVNVQVDGTIEGNVKAQDTVRLNANGVIRGDVTAEKMAMAEGASLFGQVSIGPEAKRNVNGQNASNSAGSATASTRGVSYSPGTTRPGSETGSPKSEPAKK